MRATVVINDRNGLNMQRYTARVQSNGLLRLSTYEEFVRDSERHQWRITGAWDEGGIFIGVPMVVEKPRVALSIKTKLVAAAKAKLQWDTHND